MPDEKRLIRFDWAIKNLLRDKANFDVLEGFFSAVMRETVRVVQILESESNQEEKRQKFNRMDLLEERQKLNRVDLLAEDSAGQRLIIGVQNEREADYLERLVFGTSKIITENVALGEECRSIVKVISISILYFNLGAGDNDYVYYGATEFRGLHTRKPLPVKEREVYSPDGKFRMHGKNIFTEYYLINVERFEDVIENDLDEWIYMLKHETLRDDFHAPNIDKARKKLPLLEMSLKEYKRYERYMMNLAIERDVIETAKAEGFAEGLSRMEERMEMLLKLYQNGMSVEQISAATGFDAAETRELLRLGEENDDAKD